jgi:hypothetical protein
MTDMPEKTVPIQVAASVYESEENLYTQEMSTTECVFNVSVNSDPGDPNSTAEAMKSADWKHWREGVFDEYDNFTKRAAWKSTPRPKGRKVLRTKNVYKKKLFAITKLLRYKVRNCVLGYEQIPGVDYTESYAAVVADQTIRTALGISLFYKFLGMSIEQMTKAVEVCKEEAGDEWVLADVLDVEAAFLNATLEEEVYIEIPELYYEYCKARGIEPPPEGYVFKLRMDQYGLVQVARAWVKRFQWIITRKELGMKQCKTDPCLFVKHDKNGRLILWAVTYIDDVVYGGLKCETVNLKKQVTEYVTITEIGKLDVHLGVHYALKADKLGPYFECSMEKYIQSMCSEFEEHIGKEVRDYATPAAPGSNLLANEGEEIDTSGYRKFTGKTLFAVKKVLPDAGNAVRELSMHLANPGTQQWKAAARVMVHLKHQYVPIKLRRPLDLRVRRHVDTDWASDRNDRKSITSLLTAIGFVCLVNWQCKKQNTVALSSTEAELYGESSAAQDVMFETNMLDEMLGKAVRPSIVYGDNMGAIFLARNLAVGQRTKHIDIRTRFITNLVESKQIEMEHVRSESNPADAASKNCKEATHVKHAANIYNGTFHPTIGEGVESTDYVRPYGGKRDSGRATKSNGTDGSGTETANDSFRSDSDELETD